MHFQLQTRYWVVGVILALLGVGAFVIYERSDRLLQVESIRTLQSQVAQVEVSRQLLNRGRIPADWPAAAYVSEAALNRLLDAFQGTRATSEHLPGVTFEFDSLELDVRPGSSVASLTVEASKDSMPTLSVVVKASALLIFDGVEEPETGESIARFRLSALSVKPALRLGTITADGSRFANAVASSGAIEALADSLVIRAPLRVSAKLPVKVEKDDEVALGKTKLMLHLRMPETDLGRNLELTTPVPVDKGIWLMVNDGPEILPPSPESLSNDSEALAQTIRRGEAEIRSKLGNVQLPAKDIALWASGDFLAGPLKMFAHLPAAARTVTATVSDIKGTLVDENVSVFAHDNAGLTLTLESATGSIVAREVKTRWDQTTGLHAWVTVDANATAQVKSVLKTIVGGGISADSTLNGNASHSVDVSLALRSIELGRQSALVLGPVFDCKYPKVTVETAGALKLGVELPIALVNDPARGDILLDTVPRYRRVTVDSSKGVALKDPNRWLQTSWQGFSVTTEQGGYLAQANINFSVLELTNPPISGSSVLASQVQDEWKRQTRPVCPTKPSAKILFAGQDFGPNNEFVKALVFLARRFGQTAHFYSISYERLATVIKDPGQTDKVVKDVLSDVKDTANKAYDDVEDQAKRPLKETERFFKKL